MDRKFVITYKTSSVHSEDIYITAGSPYKLTEEILDAVWFADVMNHRLIKGENVDDYKTPNNFKNNRFQVVIYGCVELPGFVSQCVDVDLRTHRYRVRWEDVTIYPLDKWFEMKTTQLLPNQV